MSTAYHVHGGQYRNPHDLATLVPGTEEDHGTYRTYAAAYKAWRGPAMLKVDIYAHRLVITPVEVPEAAYRALPG